MAVFDTLWMVVGYGILALLFVAGLMLVWESVGLFRDVTAMVVTRTSRIGDVREGRVEVFGTVRPGDRTLTDPVSGEESVAYEYTVSREKRVKNDVWDWTRYGYRTEADGGVAVPFFVEDASGRVLVEPGDPDDEHAAYDGAVNLYATSETDIHLDDDESGPASLRHLFAKADASRPDDDYGRAYETSRIEPGEEVYVLGTARFRDGERVVEGADGRFVVAGASQLRTLVYNAGWGVSKFVAGTVLAAVCGFLVLIALADLAGVSLGFV